MFTVFRDVVTAVAAEGVGNTVHKAMKREMHGGQARLRRRWKGRGEHYRNMLQRTVAKEIREKMANEYRSLDRKAKELIEESKIRVDKEFGRKLSEKFSKSMKLFWREVNRKRGGI